MWFKVFKNLFYYVLGLILLHGDIATYRTQKRDLYEDHLQDIATGLMLKDFL